MGLIIPSWTSVLEASPFFCKWIYFIFTLYSSVRHCKTYNLDIEHVVVHRGDKNSFFGYSVAQHIDQNTSWILVGAPKAQTAQPDVKRGGAVYQCHTTLKNYCQQIPFDTRGNRIAKYTPGVGYPVYEEKSNQWFGATVKSTNGLIVACAPRRIYFGAPKYTNREPVGGCIIKDPNNSNFIEYSPCRYSLDKDFSSVGYHAHGHCMAGFSTSITPDKKHLVLGAVGSWYWQGQLYVTDLSRFQQTQLKTVIRYTASTHEGPATEDSNLLGYSTAIGDFNGDGVYDVAVGIPRANNLAGKVALYTIQLNPIAALYGQQTGSYFSYCLAVTDINNDNMDDIIVGAPLYSNYDLSGAYDVGSIYIFYQNKADNFKSSRYELIKGEKTKSRFGSAVSNLGDLDADGYNDVAVGAPFDGDDGRGAVYIYRGSGTGLITKPSQIIRASDIGPALSMFGSAMSGGQDMDGNSYPDLIIGAYSADAVLFFRSKAVVKVAVNVETEPKMINLEKRDCNLFKDIEATCLEIHTCIEYTGYRVPSKLNIELMWELDSGKKGPDKRAFYQGITPRAKMSQVTTFARKSLNYTTADCINHQAYVRKDILDKLTPIRVKFEYRLKPSKYMRQSGQILPILDQNQPTLVYNQVPISNKCKDNVCIPNLVLSIHRMKDVHVVGSSTNIEFGIRVINRGEDSYLSRLFVNLPDGIHYHSIRNNNDFPIFCGPHRQGRMILCDIGNPLAKHADLMFILVMSSKALNTTLSTLEFDVQVNSTNPEKFDNTADNHVVVKIQLKAEATLLINGVSLPNEVIYNLTAERIRTVAHSISVVHLFEILNIGPSSVERVKVVILWPSYLDRGDSLLSIYDTPIVTQGDGTCSLVYLHPQNASEYFAAHDRILSLLVRSRTGRAIDKRDLHGPDEKTARLRSDRDDTFTITCSNRWCTVVICTIGRIDGEDKALIEINSVLSTQTLVKYSFSQRLEVLSLMVAEVEKMPYNSDIYNLTDIPLSHYNVTTAITRIDLQPKAKKVAIWIIAVAITCGLLLLLLLIVLLWWCGFFKRKRPEEAVKNGTAT